MARFTSGWVKTHRKIVLELLAGKPNALALYVTLQAMASIKETQIFTKNGHKIIPVGTVVTSLGQLAEMFGLNRKTIDGWLKFFEANKLVTIKHTLGRQLGTAITLCNIDDILCFGEDKADIKPTLPGHLDRHSTDITWSSGPTLPGHVLENLRIKELENERKENELNTPQEASPLSGGEGQNAIPSESTRKAPRIAKPPGRGTETWEAYSKAYERRYSVRPARNARDAALCAGLVDLVGAVEAPKIAEFYVTHSDKFYVQNLHPLTFLKRDAQKLRTEWLAGGVQMTAEKAKLIQLKNNNDEVIKRFMERNPS